MLLTSPLTFEVFGLRFVFVCVCVCVCVFVCMRLGVGCWRGGVIGWAGGGGKLANRI